MGKKTSYFTIKTLAEYWSCSQGFVRARIEDESLQHYKMGSMYRIPEKSVRRYERECERSQKATPETRNGIEIDLTAEFRDAANPAEKPSACFQSDKRPLGRNTFEWSEFI